MKKLITLTSLILLTACVGEKEPDVIKIGYVGPLTGDATAYGVDMMNGAKHQIDQVNAAGGVNSKQVEFIAEDGRCTGAEAVSAMQKLINVNKVDAIIGGVCSSETLAMAPFMNQENIVLLSPGSTSPDVTDAGNFVFRNIPSDALSAVAMAKVLNEKEMMKVAVITENTDYCIGWTSALEQQIGKDRLVFAENFDPGVKDFRTILTRLQDVEFDVLFANGQATPQTAAIVQQFREQGFTQPIVSHSGAESQQMIEIAGEAAEEILYITQPTLGEGTDAINSFIAKYGDPQQSIAFVALAYDAAGILLDSISRAGADGAAIRDDLYQTEYSGITGTVSFDSNGDVIGIPFALRTVSNGTIVDVENIPVN